MIFTITTCSEMIQKISDKGTTYQDRDYRCVGYYFDKNKAINAVMENRCDLQETTYPYAVIEAIPEGVYPVSDIQHELWFKWDDIKKAFQPCEKPNDLALINGFSIG